MKYCSVAFCLDTWFRGTIDLLETRKTKLNCCVGIFWKTQSKVIRYKRGCGARGRKYASFKKQEIKKKSAIDFKERLSIIFNEEILFPCILECILQ